MKYWNAPAADVLRTLSVNPQTGLTAAQASARADEHGPNAFERARPESVPSMVLRQFRDIANVVLLVAVALSLALAVREGDGVQEVCSVIRVEDTDSWKAGRLDN